MALSETLLIISGNDTALIKKCKKSTMNLARSIGVLIIIMFTMSLIGSTYALSKIFNSYSIGGVTGLCFGLIITNINYLTIHTLSYHTISTGSNKEIINSTTSIIFRVLFIAFTAIIISKPIESLIFKQQLQLATNAKKLDVLNRYKVNISTYFSKRAEELRNLNYNIEQKKSVRSKIKILNKEKRALISKMDKLVKKSNFYISSLIYLNNKKPHCWIITVINILLFIAPALLQVHLTNQTEYKEIKSYTDKLVIKSEYSSFKKLYNKLFIHKHNENIRFPEKYIDPPFNTIRKTDNKSYKTEAELINSIYE